MPYWVDGRSFPNAGDERLILEVPVSIGKVAKYFFKTSTRWLRPYYSTTSQMIRLSKKLISDSPKGQPVILNMMFHNVEVIPGLSPYAVDVASASRLLQQVEDYLKWINAKKIVAVTMNEFYERFRYH